MITEVTAAERIESGMLVTVRTDAQGRRTAHRSTADERPTFAAKNAAAPGEPLETEPLWPMSENRIRVIVPGPAYHAHDKSSAALWSMMGGVIQGGMQACGRDLAFSTILSRVSRELRREIGVEGARQVFRDYADLMDEAAKGDEP